MNDYSLRSPPASAARVSRESLAAWLAHSHQVGSSGDAAFSDDGESAIPMHAANSDVALKPPVPVTPPMPLKPAAVLILVINHAVAPAVLFTQRTAHLTDHAGQISFPGGRVDANDRDVFHTALREAEEETGVDAARIEIIGTIPQYTTGTGYLITPVVGWLEPPVDYRPDPTEVDECFEVPFEFLVDINNHHLEAAMYKGRMRSYYALPYGQRYIWGATAGMLVTLTRVLAAAKGQLVGEPVRRSPDSG